GRHSCEPLNFSLCRAVLAVATDICAQHQRTFSFQCFVLGGFWFLFASGSLEPRTFCSSATTRRSRCSRGLVLIVSSKSLSICQMLAIQPSRFVNRILSCIVTSVFALACFRTVTLRTATAPPKRQAIHSETLSPPPRVLYRPAPVRHAKAARP